PGPDADADDLVFPRGFPRVLVGSLEDLELGTPGLPAAAVFELSAGAGLVALWGLLFVLVLTMISGARELMTPGAWTKHGLTYNRAEDGTKPARAAVPHETGRRRPLDRLRMALWPYARHHEGRFPPHATPPEVPEDAWRLPDPSGMTYIYMPGLVAD